MVQVADGDAELVHPKVYLGWTGNIWQMLMSRRSSTPTLYLYNLYCILREIGDIKSEWTILEVLYGAVAIRFLVPGAAATVTAKPSSGHQWQKEPSR